MTLRNSGWTGCVAAGIAAAALLAFQPSLLHAQKAAPVAAGSPASASMPLPDNFNSLTVSEGTTHLIVGRSQFFDTKNRLTRVYVTNPEVLDSYTASPNQVVVTAKKPGISTLLLWDEAGGSRTYLISSDVNVEGLRQAVRGALPNETITVDGVEGRVVLAGTVSSVAVSDAAVKLAALYAKDVSNTLLVNTARGKQVRLQVRIVEVDRSKATAFAFNFFSAGGNNLASTTTGQASSTLTVGGGGGAGSTVGGKAVTIGNPLNFSLYSSKLNIGATLQDLETQQVLQILAEPEITALSGEKGNFLAGGEFPFPVVQGSSTGGTSVSIQFRPYGVKLEFSPVVNPDGTIQLRVAPEVSALDYTNAVQIAGYTIPALSTRRAETQVVVRSGQTFAISGLLDKRTTDLYANTPGISKVPVLGQLFRSKSVTHTDTELIVIVTPTVLDPLTDTSVPAEPKILVPTLDPKAFDKTLPPAALKK